MEPKEVRNLAKEGSSAIPKLEPLLRDNDVEVRREAAKALAEIGTARSLDPLVSATRDNDPEVQMLATDGLVNFYVPGYLQTGISGALRRFGTSIKSKFTDVNDDIVPAYVEVRPDVIEALGKLARGGASMDARANAARAVGILRGQAAIPDLLEAIRSKDDKVLYESLVAFQKIRDRSVAPRIRYLLNDFDPKVQVAAIQTTGILQNEEAIPDLVGSLRRARNKDVRRAALTALAMIPSDENRTLFQSYLKDKDEQLRGAAAEGLGRLKNPQDTATLQKAFEEEKKPSPRISMAFALVLHGRTELSEFSPLQLLINTLNSSAREGEAYALLVELSRESEIREKLYTAMPIGTKAEKIQLARVLSRSGDATSVEPLEKLSKDPDTEVATAALRALQTVKARL